MDIGRILPTEAAAILNVSPQFVRVAIRELETDININVDGGTPKSTDLLLVKGGTPFTTDYDKYIAGTSHTI